MGYVSLHPSVSSWMQLEMTRHSLNRISKGRLIANNRPCKTGLFRNMSWQFLWNARPKARSTPNYLIFTADKYINKNNLDIFTNIIWHRKHAVPVTFVDSPDIWLSIFSLSDTVFYDGHFINMLFYNDLLYSGMYSQITYRND